MSPWGCYVHVPWCRAQCPYCGFYIVPGERALAWEPFVDRVLAEHRARAPAFAGDAHTVYLGGGTPSRLPPEALARLLTNLPTVPGAERSCEANPEDLTDAWLQGAIEAGIGRISLGVQTFVPHVARRLGRAHTSAQATDAARRLARAPLRSWSIDLIFAVPGQTLDDLRSDLDTILSLGAPHVSIYGLTVEPGTPFASARRRGRLPDVDPDLWRDMYDQIVSVLGGAGLQRYEISSFARAGHRCDHNALYWADRPYMGLGPGAHGYAPDGTRWHNTPDLRGYLAADTAPGRIEHPSGEVAAMDLLVAGLRGIDGVTLSRLEARTGHRPDPRIVEILIEGGLLIPDPARLALTSRGFPLADAVVDRLVRALRPS